MGREWAPLGRIGGYLVGGGAGRRCCSWSRGSVQAASGKRRAIVDGHWLAACERSPDHRANCETSR